MLVLALQLFVSSSYRIIATIDVLFWSSSKSGNQTGWDCVPYEKFKSYRSI